MLFYIWKRLRFEENPGDPALRTKYGVLSGALGIALNLLMFAIKLVAALTTKSLAVAADAANNLSDAGSSIITVIGFKLSGKKPDPEHPFGHGRMEYISGFIISMLILLMGCELAESSVSSIRNPKEVLFGTTSVVILCVSVVIKLYMSLYNYRLYKIFSSVTLKSTALDSLCDAISTIAVLAAIVISGLTGARLDGYAGLIVSVFIIYNGINAARETLSPLLGRPPDPELVRQIEALVGEEEAIVGMHDLVVHDYGPGRLMISLHAEVPSDIEIFTAHALIDDLENLLSTRLGCEAVIHLDPIDTRDENLRQMGETVRRIVSGIDERLTVHDFRCVPGTTHTNLIFDVVVPFGFRISDSKLIDEISGSVLSEMPNHFCVIKLDRSRV